jgi:nucleoside-triphosphatase
MQQEIYLVTGRPGVGKTTLVRRVADSIGLQNCVGFYTAEIREKGTRTGFQWRTLDGRSGVLANLDPGPPRVGKYHVALESFESMLNDLKKSLAGKLLLIDEVGKMEVLSVKFCELLHYLENADLIRVFTVAQRGTRFIEDFKSRHAKNILELTFSNRDALRNQLVRSITKQL